MGGSLSLDNLSLLQSATEEEFFQLFKGKLAVPLRRAVEACLHLAHPSAPDVAAKATGALRRIAAESDLNAARVKFFGSLPAPRP